MTDESFQILRNYAGVRCPQVGDTFLQRVKVIVDFELADDGLVFTEPPEPPSVRLNPMDFVDLRRRLDQIARGELGAYRLPMGELELGD